MILQGELIYNFFFFCMQFFYRNLAQVDNKKDNYLAIVLIKYKILTIFPEVHWDRTLSL